MSRYKKLVGTILGGATGAGVLAIVAAAGGTLPESVAAAIAVALAAIGTWLSPPNAPV